MSSKLREKGKKRETRKLLGDTRSMNGSSVIQDTDVRPALVYFFPVQQGAIKRVSVARTSEVWGKVEQVEDVSHTQADQHDKRKTLGSRVF